MPEDQYPHAWSQFWDIEEPEEPTEPQWWESAGAIALTGPEQGAITKPSPMLPYDVAQTIAEMRAEIAEGRDPRISLGIPIPEYAVPEGFVAQTVAEARAEIAEGRDPRISLGIPIPEYDTPEQAAAQSYFKDMQEDVSASSNWELFMRGIETRWKATKGPAFERLQKGFREGNLLQKAGAIGHGILHGIGAMFHLGLIAPQALVKQQYGYTLVGSDNGPYDFGPLVDPALRAMIYNEGVTTETVAALEASRTKHTEAYDERLEATSLDIAHRQEQAHWSQPTSSAGFAGIGDYLAFLMKKSRRKAMRKEGEDERTWRYRLEAWSRGGSPLAGNWSEEMQRYLASGFRWTHLFRTEDENNFQRYVFGGMSPEDAGNATQDIALEIVGDLMLIEPIESVTFINAINAMPFKALSKPMGWAGKKVIKRFGDSWLLTESIRSQAAKRVSASSDVASLFRGAVPDMTVPQYVGYIKRLEPALTSIGKKFPTEKLLMDNMEEVVELLSKEYPPQLVENLTRYRLSQLAKVARISTDVFDSAAFKYADDFDGFILELQDKVFRKTIKEMAEEMPAVGKYWEKAQSTRWMRTLQKGRGFLVEQWLGRPSYHLFNKYDNSVRLMVNGVVPFGKGSYQKNLYAYAEYALNPEAAKSFAKYADDLGFLKDLAAILKGKPEHYADYMKRLDGMLAQGVTGGLGRGALKKARRAEAWSLTKLPWVGKKIEAFSTMSGKIEAIPRARLFMHLFLKNHDAMWQPELARILEEGVEELSSPVALRHFVEKIQDLPGKTPKAIRKLFEEHITETGGVVRCRTAGKVFEETLEASFPEDVSRAIKQALDLEAGKGFISNGNIKEIFGEAERKLGIERHAMEAAGRARYVENLPVVPETAQEFVEAVFEGATTPDDVFLAIENMDAYYAKFKAGAKTASDDAHVLWAKQEKAIQAASGATKKRLLREARASRKAFFGTTQPAAWRGWSDKAKAAYDEAADILKEMGVDVDSDLFDEARDALEGIQKVNSRRFKAWGSLLDEMDGMPYGPAREAMYQRGYGLIRGEYGADIIEAGSRLTRSREGLKAFFVSKGVLSTTPEEAHALTNLIRPGWDEILGGLDNVPAEVGRVMDLHSETLRMWQGAVKRTRLAEVAEEAVAADIGPLQAFAGRLEAFARNAASEAEETAMKMTDKVMLDYSTTENWMEVMGTLFPFLRFRVKNIPSWISMMGDHPQWAVTATMLRRYQALANQDLPSRVGQSIRIPQLIADPLLKLMGLDNTRLYWNPWNVLSLFQAIPGGTPFKSRQLMDMTGTDDASLGALWQLGQQFGIGMWPIPEFLLGTAGLLGDDWIFRDVLGTWAPMAEWVAAEFGGAEPMWKPEAFLRHKVLHMWNALWPEGSPLRRPYENPGLMTDWLMGRLAEQEVFELSPEALEMGFTLDQVELYKSALQQQAATTFVGHMTAFYFQPVTDAEIANTHTRRKKRIEQAAAGPGEEWREIAKRVYEENPKLALTHHVRFGEHPWATTAGGRVAEIIDGRIDWYTSMYWDKHEELETAHAQEIEYIFKHAPGIYRLQWESEKRHRQAKKDMQEKLEADLMAEVFGIVDKFKQEYPRDPAIKKLEEGYEMDIYYPPHLSPEAREKIQNYLRLHPEDREGCFAMAEAELNRAKAEQGTTKVKTLSLNEGLGINLSWSEHGRTEEEIRRRQADDLLWDLHANRPTYMDYEGDYEAYLVAKSEYFASLDELAMETEQASAQVSRLIDSGVSQEEATEIIRGLYSYERIEEMWRSGDTIGEAVNSVYRTAFMDKAYQYRDGMKSEELEGDENLEVRQLMWAEFTAQFQARPADDLIPQILAEYPGRWTAWELTQALEGVEMPSFEDFDRLNATGKKAIVKNIRFYYHRLPDSQKWRLDQALGSQFAQELIKNNEGYSFTHDQLGEWLAAVSFTATGQELDYLKLPGVYDGAESITEKVEAGLTPVRPEYEQERDQYDALNKAYWASRVAGTSQWEQIEQNPIWKKYSHSSGTVSYFYHQYNENVPPGWVSYDLSHHPGIKIIRSQKYDPYLSAATIKEYEDGIRLVEGFMNDEELQIVIAENGLDNKEEWPRVKELMNQYYEIPKENKGARKAFLEVNPLLKKYLKKPKATKAAKAKKAAAPKKGRGGLTYGRGTRRVSAPRVDYTQVWSTFQRMLGASMVQVVQGLVPYWNGGKLSAGMEKYLRNLYGRIGGNIGFEKWLEALRLAYIRMAAKAPSAGKPGAAPRAYYGGAGAGFEALRGRRRE